MLSKILSENPDESTAAVVTHGGMINQLYKAFLRLPITSDVYFCSDDTGIHEWVISDEVRRDSHGFDKYSFRKEPSKRRK